MDTAAAILLAFIGAGCCCLGLSSLGTAIFRFLGARRFLRDDVEVVQGKILSKSSRRRYQVLPSVNLFPQLLTKHIARYSFDVDRPDGVTCRVETSVEVPVKSWSQLEEGQSLQVMYRKAEIRMSQLEPVVRQSGTCKAGEHFAELCMASVFSVFGFVIGMVVPIATGNVLAILACILPAFWFAATLKRGGCMCCWGVCVHRADPEESLCLCGCLERRSNGQRTRWARDRDLWRSQMDFEDHDPEILRAKVKEIKPAAPEASEAKAEEAPRDEGQQEPASMPQPAPQQAATKTKEEEWYQPQPPPPRQEPLPPSQQQRQEPLLPPPRQEQIPGSSRSQQGSSSSARQEVPATAAAQVELEEVRVETASGPRPKAKAKAKSKVSKPPNTAEADTIGRSAE